MTPPVDGRLQLYRETYPPTQSFTPLISCSQTISQADAVATAAA
ncbi:hypothetical protein ACGFX2_33110 [Streptomyces goshikiensis]